MARIVIIGAGFTGLAAAYEFSNAGHQVTIFESEDDIGGLAGTFELQPGIRVEKFYHHWFTSDTAVLGLISDLGLNDSIRYVDSNTGLYYANSVFRLASPLDLLRFPAIPLLDRIRTGLMALRARSIDEWRPLEDISAAEWLIKYGGKKAYDVMWNPLLHGKFGSEAPNISAVWIWNKLKLRGSSRNTKGGESLVYFGGGFGALTQKLRAALESRGVTIHTSTPVQRVTAQSGKVTGVVTARGTTAADIVLSTVPLPLFPEIAPDLPPQYSAQCRSIRFLGNTCLVMRLRRSLSKTYWLNIADPHFPFVGIIEHTNLDDKANYGGEHIAYLSKYLPVTDDLFKMNSTQFLDYCEPFIRRIFPEFSREWVIDAHLWKAHYSQPVITKHYSSLIPSHRTPIEGLWQASMAQIYPEDRGTNYAVREGRRIARSIAGIS